MTFRKFHLVLPLVFAFFIIAHPVSGQVDPKGLLERVRSDIEARHKASVGIRFSHEMRLAVSGSENYQVSLFFDPDLPRLEQWKVLAPAETEDRELFNQAKKRIDQNVQNNPDAQDDRELILASFPLKSEQEASYIGTGSDGLAIYSFDITEDFMSSDGVDGSGDMKKLSRFLSGELAIDTRTEQLSWLRIYSKKPFKPVPVAKIKKFDIRLLFAPAWQGGPIIQQKSISDVSGSALFKKFSERSDMEISAIVQKQNPDHDVMVKSDSDN